MADIVDCNIKWLFFYHYQEEQDARSKRIITGRSYLIIKMLSNPVIPINKNSKTYLPTTFKPIMVVIRYIQQQLVPRRAERKLQKWGASCSSGGKLGSRSI